MVYHPAASCRDCWEGLWTYRCNVCQTASDDPLCCTDRFQIQRSIKENIYWQLPAHWPRTRGTCCMEGPVPQWWQIRTRKSLLNVLIYSLKKSSDSINRFLNMVDNGFYPEIAVFHPIHDGTKSKAQAVTYNNLISWLSIGSSARETFWIFSFSLDLQPLYLPSLVISMPACPVTWVYEENRSSFYEEAE